MKKSKFAFLTGASKSYLAGLNALLNSLEVHSHKEDFLLVSFDIPEDYLKKAQETFSFNIRIFKPRINHQVQGTAIERFRIAYEIGKEYDAVCLLDADMFFVNDVARFFLAASKGLIIVGSNGMHISFTKKHQEIYKCDLGVEEYPHYLIHTTAPIFLSPQDLDWFSALYKSKRVDSFDDFLYLNILGIKMRKTEKMICMPPYLFSQIHHFGVKPNTRIIKKNGVLLSETEERIAVVHGKWFDKNWYTGLMVPMSGYFKDNELGKLHERRALESRETILNEFLKYCYLSKLDLRNFMKVKWLEEKLERLTH